MWRAFMVVVYGAVALILAASLVTAAFWIGLISKILIKGVDLGP